MQTPATAVNKGSNLHHWFELGWELVFGMPSRSVANMASSPKNVITEMEGTFVIDSPIARFHQYGTRDMPARKILFIPRDFDRDINKKTLQYIIEGSKLI